MAAQVSKQCLNRASRLLCLSSARSNTMFSRNRHMSSLLVSIGSSEQGRPRLTAVSNMQLTSCQCLHTTPLVREGNKIKVNVKTDSGTVTLECKEGDSILDLINNNNYEIPGYGACEGTIACSTCHVVLSQPDYDAHKKGITVDELDLLDMVTEATDTSRLGCQVYVTKAMDGSTVYVPPPTDLRDA